MTPFVSDADFTPRSFVVTYIGDRGEAAATVTARNKEQAKRRLRERVPTAHIVHVQLQQKST